MPPALYWALALVVLGVVGWVWWHAGQVRRHEPESAGITTPGPAPVSTPSVRSVPPPRPVTNFPAVVAAPILPPATQSVAAAPPVTVRPTNGPSTSAQTGAETPKFPVTTAGFAQTTNAPSLTPKTNAAGTVPATNVAGLTPATNAPGTAVVAKATEPAVVAPAVKTNEFPRPVQGWFEAQLALDRLGLSPGSIDGSPGAQTRSALRAFQRKAGLRLSGDLDEATRTNLLLGTAPCVTYKVTPQDMARLQPLSHSWLGKSRQTALEYETILEMLAEKGHSHPKLIRSLNSDLRWGTVGAGVDVCLPDTPSPPVSAKAALAVISLGDKTLEALDADGRLLGHFPCSIAQHVDKRPVGDLHVVVLIRNPTYTFNPDIFPESEEARRLKTKLILPPGPNNPVGLTWIGLDKPGYGIHGTPSPELVGRTESHGCFRLANWNARYLLSLAWVGMPVRVVK